MLTDVLAYLRCPHCDRPLAAYGSCLRCPRQHTFDIARQGYADLATGPLRHGDTPAMVTARETFLASGAYDFLGTALAAAAGRPGLVVDVGGGTGYHLARVLDGQPAAVGLVVDAAKPALRRAARAHPRAAAIRADAWRRLPLAGGSAAVLLNVFAPRNGPEFRRVLAPDGLLLVATPAPDHLAELRTLASQDGVRLLQVDPEKPDRVTAALAPWFRWLDETVHTRQLSLTHPLVRALVSMGPSAAHTDPAALARAVAALPDPLPVTATIRLAHYAAPPRRT